jgi:Xaa-Pro aminopeptidase
MNPIDAVWADRPAPSDARLVVHPDALAGRSSAEKRQEIAEWLVSESADATVLSALDSIAWLFNTRGADVDRTPVALAFSVVHADGTADLFVAPEKIAEDVARHLGNAVRLHPRDAFARYLAELGGKRVTIDPANAVAAIFGALEAADATILPRRDPTILAKAQKTAPRSPGTRPLRRATGLRSPASSTGCRWRRRRAADGAVGRPPAPPVPGSDRRAEGPELRHNLGRGAERRRGPLPRHTRDRPRDRARHAVSGRLRAASIRTAPPM